MLPRQPEQQRHAHHHQHRDRDLRRAEPQHRAAHGTQLGQAEFETDAEHQKHHADLGQIMHLLGFTHPAERVRADGHADDQVAEHRRLLETTTQRHHQNGSGQ